MPRQSIHDRILIVVGGEYALGLDTSGPVRLGFCPADEEDGEVARWRIEAELNELGKALLRLDDFLSYGFLLLSAARSSWPHAGRLQGGLTTARCSRRLLRQVLDSLRRRLQVRAR